jgi:hypothetical protein
MFSLMQIRGFQNVCYYCFGKSIKLCSPFSVTGEFYLHYKSPLVANGELSQAMKPIGQRAMATMLSTPTIQTRYFFRRYHKIGLNVI